LILIIVLVIVLRRRRDQQRDQHNVRRKLVPFEPILNVCRSPRSSSNSTLSLHRRSHMSPVCFFALCFFLLNSCRRPLMGRS
jgi:hypothetical protein